MPKTFREAFDGVKDELESKLDTKHGLLAKLVARHVITERHRTAVEVTWLVDCKRLY